MRGVGEKTPRNRVFLENKENYAVEMTVGPVGFTVFTKFSIFFMDSRLREHAHAKAHRFYLQKCGFKIDFHEFSTFAIFGWCRFMCQMVLRNSL